MRRALVLAMAILMIGAGAIVVLDDARAVDPFPPRISGVKVTTIGETWFEVAWETNEPAKGGIEWGLKGYSNVTNEFEGFVTDHLLNVTGLKRGTEYHFRVFAVDLSGNEARSEGFTVGTYPFEEDDGGYSLWTWAIIMAVTSVLLVYFLFIRRPS